MSIAWTNGRFTRSWEADVTRVEAGVSAAVYRRVRVKAVWQRNWRPLAGRVRHDSLVIGQLAVWF